MFKNLELFRMISKLYASDVNHPVVGLFLFPNVVMSWFIAQLILVPKEQVILGKGDFVILSPENPVYSTQTVSLSRRLEGLYNRWQPRQWRYRNAGRIYNRSERASHWYVADKQSWVESEVRHRKPMQSLDPELVLTKIKKSYPPENGQKSLCWGYVSKGDISLG